MNKVAVGFAALLASLCCRAAAQQPTNVRIPAAARAAPGSRILRLHAVAPLPSNADSVALRRGEFVAARSASAPTRRDSGAGTVRWTMPIQLTGVGAEGELLNVRPSVEVEGGGLSYQVADGDFSGAVLLGLISGSHPDSAHRLGRTVRVLLTASAGTVAPAQIVLDHTNLPFTEVHLAAESPPSDVIMLRIRTDLDSSTDSIPVSILRPGIRLAATPKRIAGYGLEVATLAVMVDVARPRGPAAVALTADRGKVEPVVATLDSSGTATSSIRSAGLGRATITAQSQSLQPATEVVDFVFPKAFLIASIIGGLLGGLVREGWAEWQDKQHVGVWGFITGVVLAALVGMIVVVAWALGINLLDIKPVAGSGEALIGVITALGAFGGLSLIAKKVGGAPPTPVSTTPPTP